MIVGIDLGTTYSAVAYINSEKIPEVVVNSEGSRTTPSAVMFEEDDSVIVGEIAKESSIIEPCNVVEYIKKEMGNPNFIYRTKNGKKYTPEEISALILKKLKIDAEQFLGEKVHKAVITVPAYFTDAQRKSTQDAGELAGLSVIKIINEPTAAAIAYASSNKLSDINILVYDLGGGTFDATIINYKDNFVQVKSTDGIRNLGGHFFDQQIVNYIVDVFEDKYNIDLYDDEYLDVLEDINKKAEACKIQLTARNQTFLLVNCGNIKEKIKITREQFNQTIKTMYERTERIVLNVLKDSGLSWDDIDKVLLVGGSSRIPYIRERLKQISGKEPCSEVNPDEAVAIGAAIQGSILENNSEAKVVEKIKISDVCSHGIGLITLDGKTMDCVNTVIIPRNTTIPVKHIRKFYTSDDDQEYIKLDITEGEGYEVEDVNIIGSFEIKIPRGLKKGTEVEIEMVLDENQIVHVYTKIMDANDFYKEIHINRKSNLNLDQIEKKKDLISNVAIS